MIDELAAGLPSAAAILAFTLMFVVLLTVASYTKDFLAPYALKEAMVRKDNTAVGITLGGYYLAVCAAFAGAALGPSQGFLTDLQLVAVYALLGVVLLNVSRLVFERLMFRSFDAMKLVAQDGNVAVAAVSFGAYVATGLIAGAAVSGQGGGWISSIVFFVLGQAALLVMARVYEKMTPYSVEAEVANGNVAAGVAFAGTLVAVGLILMRAASGDFIGWERSLTLFFIDAVAAVVLLTLLRFVVDRVLIRGAKLDDEIAKDRNLAAGFVEAAALVSFAGAMAAVI